MKLNSGDSASTNKEFDIMFAINISDNFKESRANEMETSDAKPLDTAYTFDTHVTPVPKDGKVNLTAAGDSFTRTK